MFSDGQHSLRTDTSFLDTDRGRLSAFDTLKYFNYSPVVEKHLYLTDWKTLNDKQAVLHFNLPLKNDDDMLSLDRYTLAPVGSIQKIAWEDATRQGVIVTIYEAAFGALGYPISITVRGLESANGAKLLEGEGNTALFSAYKTDLSEVFVYPSPVRLNNVVAGVRFANLTQLAQIEVFNASGRTVNAFSETDGDGGYEWDLLDQTGQKIKPGVYIFRVSAKDVKDFVGKFTVVE